VPVTKIHESASDSNTAQPAVPWREHAWEVIHPLLLLAGAVLIGVLCVLFMTGVEQVGAADWVQRFSTSPGAAGVAAGIGFWAITRQLHHNKGVERDAAWWKSFEWVTDRALPKDKSDSLPYLVAVDMLAPLVESASNMTQQRICGSFLDHLDGLHREVKVETPDHKVTSTPERPGDLVVSDLGTGAGGERERMTLENYAKLTRGNLGRSFAVEARLYNLRVLEAVSRIAGARYRVHIGHNATHAVIEGENGSRVRVVPSGATGIIAALNAALSEAQASDDTTLVVVGGDRPNLGSMVSDHVYTVRWRGESDDPELEAGMLRALTGAPSARG
jgi:hypothetical protein